MHISRTSQLAMSIQKFESAILRIRDILRREGITGMDSMKHCTLYIAAKYMNRQRCASLGIDDKLCWESLLSLIRESPNIDHESKQYSLDRIKNDLIQSFDKLFQTSEFNFRISRKGHVDIMEALADVDIEEIHVEKDLLGWVYEQHLSKGSSSARDLGQFFTDRSLCYYMTALCAPKRLANGEIESVCDPSMGTGGFLTTAIQYYRDHVGVKNEEWETFKAKIHGCDIDRFVSSVSAINCFIETHGTAFPHVGFRNSITDDLVHTGYDVILANMPFGVKGLTHADCCNRVKDLKIRGTKSEPLFLQLMMVSLNPGGRCAVVVPDGMLVNTSKLHDGTRKYLLDHFEVRRIVKMKGQFFMNTSIQPSVIFFEKTGRPTTAVEFWEATKTDKGEIMDVLIQTVPRERFDTSCSMDLKRYQEDVGSVANPAGYPMMKLGDLFDVPSISHRYTNKDSCDNGIPFYNGCYNSPQSCINTTNPSFASNNQYLIMIKDGGGDHNSPTVGLGKTFLTKGSVCIASQNTILVPKNTSNNLKYIYYILCLKIKDIRDLSNPSINLEHIPIKSIINYEIPLPPLAIQEEIVATLDRIYQPGTTELADTLKMTDKAMDLVLANPTGATLEPLVDAQRIIRKSAQMVADVKAQMVAIVKASMAGVQCKKYVLSDLANDNPDNLTKADKFERINYVDLGSVKEGNISSIQTIPMEEKPSRAQRKIQNGDIIWGSVRPLSRSYAYIETAVENMIGSSGFVVVRNKDTNKVLSKYLYYVITTDDCINYLNNHSTGSSYPAFKASTIMAYEVVIPSIAIQTKTLERLEALQSQLTALENLQKQSEDNARFILESYLSSAAQPTNATTEEV